ncbi:MAG: cadmium-translocating P-type ATPase [Bacteroidetes bacterium]|nr:MAG: cadmium-translocating P-type ATPase [Bacteroidota bacterium]
MDAGTLRSGDLLLINAGETVPADSKIIWGEAWVNESIITGESLPVHKTQNEFIIGGSTLTSGSVKAYVQKAAAEGVLSNIKKMVEDAQTSKPPVQQLADKISAVFVPTVVGIALVCFLVNYWVFAVPITQSFLRAVAVLVIACPCAMGLATPAAVAVGLGRAATNGILFKNASTLELFKGINCVVFDKTGTLTTGNFMITQHAVVQPVENWQQYVYALEKHSTHPLATCLLKEYKTNVYIKWKQIEEVKGWGVRGVDDKGIEWKIGSHKWLMEGASVPLHSVYLWRNSEVIAWWDLADEIRPEAKEVIKNLHAQQVKTVLLSGDATSKCAEVAEALGIQEFLAEQTPASKLAVMEKLTASYTVAMVGDGINDAPALAKASVGISLGNATQLAILSSQVILMKNNLAQLPQALWLGRHTYKTIQTNFIWALGYNVVAIPIAALGFLSPTIGALVMGFSDVILVLNSILLKFKRMP